MTASFTTAEGLRHVLVRIHAAAPDGWNTDPDVEPLMRFTIAKYRPLAYAHHCEPEDSAVAAFDAMRTRAVRSAGDPWAVVTRAVQLSLIAEERANGLLCSSTQARRPLISAHRDVRRLSDSDADLLDFHPAFRVGPDGSVLTHQPAEEVPTAAGEAVTLTTALFISLGWPADTTTCALDYITSRLIESGSRPAAHALLRRDHAARAVLDLSRRSWSTLLRLVLGNPHPDHWGTREGRGILLRLLIGHPVAELLADDALVLDISASAPRPVALDHTHASPPAPPTAPPAQELRDV